MAAVPICFSLLQVPRSRIQAFNHILKGSFHALGRSTGYSSRFKILVSQTRGPEGGYSRRWIRRPISTKTEVENKTSQSDIRYKMLDKTVSRSIIANINDTDMSGFQNTQYCDIQQLIAEKKDLSNLVTVIVFDLETTGFLREGERIIEIALQDLTGGENSTFQTLINPGRIVPNAHIHGITTEMVTGPNIPRMEELIPILLQYIRSRQKPGGYILWVAHNARSFDVPFMIKEFARCSYEVPSNWWYLDTILLTRELMKSGGPDLPADKTLQALRKHYRIPLVGSAHRAMSDVQSLVYVLQRLTLDLKLDLSNLVERSFKATDLLNSKKKKKN